MDTDEKTISCEESSLVKHKKSPDVEVISTDNIVEFHVDKDSGPDSICVSDVSRNENIKQKKDTNLVETEIKDGCSCQKVVVDCLLKHYKCLSLFGIRLTWLGVHKIYRVALVACRTFIIEPVKRLYVITALVLAMTVVNSLVKPYKDQRANTTANLSYVANLCIAALNLVKAHLVAFGCDTNCQFRDKVLQYMDTVEDVLLMYAPVAAVGLGLIYKGFQKIFKKRK